MQRRSATTQKTKEAASKQMPTRRKQLRNPMSPRAKSNGLAKSLIGLVAGIILIAVILYVAFVHAPALPYPTTVKQVAEEGGLPAVPPQAASASSVDQPPELQQKETPVEAVPPVLAQQLDLSAASSVRPEQAALLEKETKAADVERRVEEHAEEQKPKHHGDAKPKALTQKVVILKTEQGDIHIALRKDLSPESVRYIRALFKSGKCDRCNIYRAENGILQGVMENKDIHLATVKGICPAGSETVQNDCPDWDASCGCHGPVMTKGMVAWAGGQLGPDFFIDSYDQPGVWWGTQHTVWGEIVDRASLDLVSHVRIFFPCACDMYCQTHLFVTSLDSQIINDLPNEVREGMTFLKKPLFFEMELSTEWRALSSAHVY